MTRQGMSGPSLLGNRMPEATVNLWMAKVRSRTFGPSLEFGWWRSLGDNLVETPPCPAEAVQRWCFKAWSCCGKRGWAIRR